MTERSKSLKAFLRSPAVMTAGVSTRAGVGGRRHRRRRRAQERRMLPMLRLICGTETTSAAYWITHASPGGPVAGLVEIIKQKKAARLLAGTEVTLGGMVGSIGLRAGWPR